IGDESPARPGREDASGAPAFRRLDPLIGLNYNLSPEHGLYLSFSQGFRAPALLELTCASPAAICPGLQAGTAPDPPFEPLPTTRRTTTSGGTSRTEQVRAGNEFPLVPRHRAHAGVELHPREWLSLSISGTFVGAQRLRGDEENVAAKLDPYFSVDGAIRVSVGGFLASARIVNLLDASYSTFGTFAQNGKLPGAPVEPFLTPGRPFQIFVGVAYGCGWGTYSTP